MSADSKDWVCDNCGAIIPKEVKKNDARHWKGLRWGFGLIMGGAVAILVAVYAGRVVAWVQDKQ